MCLPRCGNSGRSDALKLLFPGLLGVSLVALQRPDGDGVNVSLESNQIILIPVKRGPKRREGGHQLFSGDFILIYVAGARIIGVNARTGVRVRLGVWWVVKVYSSQLASSLSGAAFREHDLYFPTSCTVYGEAAQILGGAVVFGTLCT